MGRPYVYGQTRCPVTGESRPDTDDERLRQGIAALLMGDKGFARSELAVRVPIVLDVPELADVTARADFVVELEGRPTMLVRYAPGSLVSRQRSVVAAARVIAERVVPIAVITNGRDALTLDAEDGRELGAGLAAIPDRATLLSRLDGFSLSRPSRRQREAEARIVAAFEALECACSCNE